MSEVEETAVPCRLHVVLAREADVGVVFRRGPSKWWHILRWDLKELTLQSGAWIKGQLYPRRCGVSMDGQLLGYFALKGKWGAYFAVSKVPWLTALAAWKTGTTYTTGCVFGPQRGLTLYGVYLKSEPFHGRYPWPVSADGMWKWRHGRYFNEYMRGWKPIEEGEYGIMRTGQLQEKGVRFYANKERPLILEKRSERTKRILGVSDSTDLMSSMNKPNREGVYYLTDRKNVPEILPDARWADWDNNGRILVATHAGTLQVYTVTRKQLDLIWEYDLNDLTPEPVRSPDWARSW